MDIARILNATDTIDLQGAVEKSLNYIGCSDAVRILDAAILINNSMHELEN